MLIILYGPPGVGKSYICQWLAKRYAFYCYDADTHLTQQMRQCINNRQPFSQMMRDAFFTQVIRHIQRYLKQYHAVVMAQAISQKKNREQLRRAFPDARFVHINTSAQLQLERLESRGDWVTADWVDKLIAVQEPANTEHDHINNNHDTSHLEQQFSQLFKQWDCLQYQAGPVK
ncbi:gluconokinase [Piscirickettsia salmonis]|uniref:gluconokinase n=1 Tax=Piscirickettsia salmonis TaxID=1238 RepID=UPI000F094E15|nr:guanylate kinase [Piscirickettsiaceae bacterium NZ-RLO2]